MFVYANTLGVSVDKLIELFYEEELKENQRAIDEFSLEENTKPKGIFINYK